MNKEKIIKEFRERFPDFNDPLYGSRLDRIETFWLSKLQAQKQELLEKIIKEVQQNQEGTFTDEGGNDCWYIDKLIERLKTF